MITSALVGNQIKGTYSVITKLYQVTSDINQWIDSHIDQLKVSENETHARTGRVLEGAKYGFGLGYIAPVVIISLGQFLCGFTLSGLMTIGTATTLSNPIAMTCAALGAVYYGWNALSEQEKAETIERLRADLNVGAELVRSIADFVISKTKELLSSHSLKELKEMVANYANTFGRTLGDVTHAFSDVTKEALSKTRDFVDSSFDKVVDSSEKLLESVNESAETLINKSKSVFNKDPINKASLIENDELSLKLTQLKKLYNDGLLSEKIYLEKQRAILDENLD